MGFNFGVDFAGGTVVELKFNQPVSAADVRKRAEDGGLHDVSVQNIGSEQDNAFLLRMGGVTQLTEENAEKAKAAINALGDDAQRLPGHGQRHHQHPLHAAQLTNDAIKQAVEELGHGRAGGA